MKLENYAGIDSEAVTIESPTDIYPLLDWCHTQMIVLQERTKDSEKKIEYQRALFFLSETMDRANDAGFGNHDDIENINH